MTIKNKIYLLALICVLTATTDKSFSQNYLSLFGDTSTTWDIILHGYCDGVCSQTITVTGDTTINSDIYKIISGLPGFVREDTVQGKAWFYDTYYNAEYLIMDLGLNLGDTFIIYNFNNTAFPFLVDSVYYVSSKKHVRLDAWTRICALNEQITFIEGSGTTASFGYQRDLNGDQVTSSMLCQHKNGVKVAGNILFNDTCYECSVGIAEYNSDANTVTIFPNPTINELSIGTNDFYSKDLDLTIYNVLGECVIKQQLTKEMTTINVSTLVSGMYVVVFGDSFSNKRQRLIKK